MLPLPMRMLWPRGTYSYHLLGFRIWGIIGGNIMFTFGDNTIWRVNQSRRPNNISLGGNKGMLLYVKSICLV
jgi:hypothetical protein